MVSTLQEIKAREGDVVELVCGPPEYAFKRGQRGTVVEVFTEPREAYDIEIRDDQGDFLGFAYSVRPEQISNISWELFERGKDFFEQGKTGDAARAFKQAIDLSPGYIGILHNSIVQSFEESGDWAWRIQAMRFVLRVDPSYRIARVNLAVSYLNYGVERANLGYLDAARDLFHIALGIESQPDIVTSIRQNLAAAHTSAAIKAHEESRMQQSRGNNEEAERKLKRCMYDMAVACAFDQTGSARRNLGLSYGFFALFCLDVHKSQESIHWFEMAEDTGLLLPWFLNDYGVALEDLGRRDEALVAFERALILAPDHEVIQGNIEALEKSEGGRTRIEHTAEAFHPAPAAHPADYVTAAVR